MLNLLAVSSDSSGFVPKRQGAFTSPASWPPPAGGSQMEQQGLELTAAEQGKRVVDIDGTVVGRVIAVRDGRCYVAEERSLLDTIRAKLGLSVDTSEAHPLDAGSVARVTAETVYLRGRLSG